jgi:hypothetical protein
MIEVKEMIEKRSIIISTRKDRNNSMIVKCISEDPLKDKSFIVSVLGVIRKAERLFVNRNEIVAFIDSNVVEERFKADKRLIGNLENGKSYCPPVEYLDNRARQMRRS